MTNSLHIGARVRVTRAATGLYSPYIGVTGTLLSIERNGLRLVRIDDPKYVRSFVLGLCPGEIEAAVIDERQAGAERAQRHHAAAKEQSPRRCSAEGS